MAKRLPSPVCKVPGRLKWDFNASTGSSIADLGGATRLIRYGGSRFYRAEYWGDYSLKFPIGRNALTPAKALRELCADVQKRKKAR